VLMMLGALWVTQMIVQKNEVLRHLVPAPTRLEKQNHFWKRLQPQVVPQL